MLKYLKKGFLPGDEYTKKHFIDLLMYAAEFPCTYEHRLKRENPSFCA
jgi:hypothetical protein